jgi:hypothetical protein
MAKNLRAMLGFDPSQPSRVHDSLNDTIFVWKPQWAMHYRRFVRKNEPGVVEWDGRLLDGRTVGDVVEFRRRKQAP